MITEEQYNRLSEKVYWTENSKDDVPYPIHQKKNYNYNDRKLFLGQFQVLSVEDNTTNGMQGYGSC